MEKDLKNRCLFGLILLICSSFTLAANDAYVERAGGSIVPIDSPNAESHSSITMKKESIKIDLNKDTYHVHVDFEFYNEGDETTINVGFPQWFYGTTEKANLLNFKTTLNNKNIEFTEVTNGITADAHAHKMIDKWFVREITFPAKTITKTSVDYDCRYSHQGWNYGAEYLFGTGKTWNGPIGKQTIIITNNLSINYAINGSRVFFIENNKYSKVSDSSNVKSAGKTFEIVRENISPEAFDSIEVELVPEFVFYSPQGFMDEDDWILNQKRLSKADTAFYTDEQLRLLRNLIFAWHGHIFKSKDINDWLEKNSVYSKWDGEKYINASWYTPTHKVDESEFSEIEKANLKIIQKEEAERK